MNQLGAAPSASFYDVEAIRADFPILGRQVRGRPLVYLDTAASAQKPRAVLEAMTRFYETSYANVHRSVHRLAELATEAYERARQRVASTLDVESREIVFTRGTTEAINLVAHSFAQPRLAPGREVLITHLEHHSNIVPWQLACAATGGELKVAPIDDHGAVDLDAFSSLLSERTVIAAFCHVSNALGTVNPIREMIALAKRAGAAVLIDGAQAVQHTDVVVGELDCDFYAFSAHKVYGPTGIGVLWGRADRLEAMPPYQGGGEMIRSVSFSGTEFADIPHRFEAGTPNMAAAVGLEAALEYLEAIGRSRIAEHEAALLAYAEAGLDGIPEVRRIGTARHRAGVVSFIVDGVHPHDLATLLDQQGIAIRAGHHCAQPAMERYGLPATARASVGLYNTFGEIDQLVAGIRQAQEIFGR